MKLLIDTHVLIWWLTAPDRISMPVRTLLAASDSDIMVSAVSAFEISVKKRVGKLPFDDAFLADFEAGLRGLQFSCLPISCAHGARAGTLAASASDPFDRLLAAQSIAEQIPIATIDPALAALGATVVW